MFNINLKKGSSEKKNELLLVVDCRYNTGKLGFELKKEKKETERFSSSPVWLWMQLTAGWWQAPSVACSFNRKPNGSSGSKLNPPCLFYFPFSFSNVK